MISVPQTETLWPFCEINWPSFGVGCRKHETSDNLTSSPSTYIVLISGYHPHTPSLRPVHSCCRPKSFGAANSPRKTPKPLPGINPGTSLEERLYIQTVGRYLLQPVSMGHSIGGRGSLLWSLSSAPQKPLHHKERQSSGRPLPPSHVSRLLLPVATSQVQKNVPQELYKMMAPIKRWHHNISSGIPGAVCPWWRITFPTSAGAAPQVLCTVVTPFLSQLTAVTRSYCDTSSPASLPTPSSPIEMAPQQRLAAGRTSHPNPWT